MMFGTQLTLIKQIDSNGKKKPVFFQVDAIDSGTCFFASSHMEGQARKPRTKVSHRSSGLHHQPALSSARVATKGPGQNYREDGISFPSQVDTTGDETPSRSVGQLDSSTITRNGVRKVKFVSPEVLRGSYAAFVCNNRTAARDAHGNAGWEHPVRAATTEAVAIAGGLAVTRGTRAAPGHRGCETSTR
jgi:hypothetical protein